MATALSLRKLLVARWIGLWSRNSGQGGLRLRKLIVSEFVSLDGVMEAPGGEPGHPHSGWVIDFIGEEQLRYKLNETLEAEALLIGRVTYESFAEAWPRRKGEFADKMNSMRKYVASRTLTNPAWNNTTVIGGDVVTEVEKLRQGDGGPILATGSRMLVHTLLGGDLVDELRVMVFPVVLGSGRRLFPDSPRKITLKLTDVQTFASGVVANIYQPEVRSRRRLASADREIDDALAALERPAFADVKARGE
jgi:dihydrofolate reductase